MAQYRLRDENGNIVVIDTESTINWTQYNDYASVPESEALMTSNRTLVPMLALTEKIKQDVNEAAQQVADSILSGTPEGAQLRFMGTYSSGVNYFINDVVQLELSDGRIGSYIAVTGTVEFPQGSADWQVLSLPAPTAQNSSGYTLYQLSQLPANPYLIGLASEGRFILERDAAKQLGFTQLSSLGNAVVALKNPASGTPGAITWASNVQWADDGPGVAPGLTATPGRGDVLLFQCWDGINVIGKLFQKNVAFDVVAISQPALLPNQKLSYLFNPGANLLKNAVTDADHLQANTGAARTPFGLVFDKGETARRTSALSTVNFSANQSWTFWFCVQGMLAYLLTQAESSRSSPIGFASPTASNKYIRPEFFKTGTTVNGAITIRDDETNSGGFAGSASNLKLDTNTIPKTATSLDVFSIEYDGAGGYNFRHINTDAKITDASGVAETNLFPAQDPAKISNFSAGMMVSLSNTTRSTGTFYDMPGTYLYTGAIQKVLNQTERKQAYNNLKTYLAARDASGPQLPALAY